MIESAAIRAVIRTRIRNVIVVVFGVGLLAACATPSPLPTYPAISFANLPPIRLDVAKLEVEVTYKPPLKSPNVDHLSPLPPAVAAERWARERILPVGSSGSARVIISNGAIVERPLDRTKGLKGLITRDQTERYDGVLEVTLEIRSDRYRDAYVKAEAERSRSVAEDATLNQREMLWFKISEDLIKEINTQMDRTIPDVLRRWLR